jgi:hypothetical protein
MQPLPLYQIGQKVGLCIPERNYDAKRPVLSKILDLRLVTTRRRNYYEYLVSHRFDTAGEWRSESLLTAPPQS